MKVKKFKGLDMPEIMQQVRKELGADAVILNSKVIHEGGFLGLFKKRKIEVLAAVDQSPLPGGKRSAFTNKKVPSSIVHAEKTTPSNQEALMKEIREMKKWIKLGTYQDNAFPPVYQEVFNTLIKQEIDYHLAYDFIDTVQKRNKKEDIFKSEIIKQLKFEIRHRLSRTGTFGENIFDKQLIHLVGPTGVGKTTTIAKIAAHCLLTDHKKVAFITTDTYRIAAIEQLKTYAKILDVPLEVAYNTEDYQKAKRKFSDYDFIFVDTAGRNFQDEKYVKELGSILELNHEANTFLVLSLTARAQDTENIYRQFQHVPIKQLIFTKKDETATYGSLLNIPLRHNTGIAYITNGQDVPDDIEKASIEKIADLLVGE